MKKNVVFVCTGNTCRSPMAEALAKKLLQQMEGQTFEIEFTSAGMAAFPGDSASAQAIEVMADYGIKLTEHQAKLLSKDLIIKADLILTMSNSHREHILNYFPEFKEKIFTIRQFVDATDQGNISDPFGQPKETYAACAKELAELIEKALQKALKKGI